MSHLSHAERGLSVVPQQKREGSGPRVNAERQEAHDSILRENGEHLQKHPEELLALLSAEGRAVWTQRDMDRMAHRYTLDDEQFQRLRAAVVRSPHLIHLEDGKFTSSAVLETEQKLLDSAENLHRRNNHNVTPKNLDPRLNEDQREAVKSLCEGGDLVIVEGAPGVGKSFMLKDAVNAWHDEGYRVIAGSLQSFQAANFARDAGIGEAGSLARWETLWQHEKQELGPKTIMVIDEFGMVGTEQAQRILAKAEAAGAKVCLIGDRHQLPAIQHGAPLRMLADELDAKQIREIVRQDSEWHREAIKDIRAGREKQGYEALKAHGCIKETSRDEAFREMVSKWKAARDEGRSAALLAYRRQDVFELNKLARSQVKAELSGPAVSIETPDGAIELQRGDEVMLRQNDNELKVKNGEVGRVLQVEGERLRVRMHDGRDVSIDTRRYRDEDGQVPVQLAHAYTGHKSQGATYDVGLVYSDALANREWLHVAVSRPRHEVRVFAEDREALARAFSKTAQKEMARDFKRLEKGKEQRDDRKAEIVRSGDGGAGAGGHRRRTGEVSRGDAFHVRQGHREDLQRDGGSDGNAFLDRPQNDARHGAHDRGRQPDRATGAAGAKGRGGERRQTHGHHQLDSHDRPHHRHHRPLDQAPLGAGRLADGPDRDSRGANRHLDQPAVGRGRGHAGARELRQRHYERDDLSPGQAGQAFGPVQERHRAAPGKGGLGLYSGAEAKERQEVARHGEAISRGAGERQGAAAGGVETGPYRPGGGFSREFSRLAVSLRELSERSRERSRSRESSVAQAHGRNRARADNCSKALGGLERQRQGLERGTEQIQRQVDRMMEQEMGRGRGISR